MLPLKKKTTDEGGRGEQSVEKLCLMLLVWREMSGRVKHQLCLLLGKEGHKKRGMDVKGRVIG